MIDMDKIVLQGKELTPITFLEELSFITLMQQRFKYKLWIDESSKQYQGMVFYGTLVESNFNLVRIHYGKHFFTPIFKGSISLEDEKVRIDLKTKISPCVRIAYGFLCLNILFSLAAFLATFELVCIGLISVNATLLIIFALLNTFHTKKAVSKTNELFKNKWSSE